MQRVIMSGLTGHTGSAVARRIDAHPDLQLVAAIGNQSAGQDVGYLLHGTADGRLVYSSVPDAVAANPADVLVDFTTPEAAERNLSDAVSRGLHLVVGTTGLDEGYVEDLAFRIEQEGLFGLFASNFSLGIVALAQFGEKLSALFDLDNMRIVETHNVAKKDMPSGTAVYLQRKLSPSQDYLIPITSNRVDARASRHEIHLDMGSETLLVQHNVLNPETFGAGVVYVLTHSEGQTGVYMDLTSFIDGRLS